MLGWTVMKKLEIIFGLYFILLFTWILYDTIFNEFDPEKHVCLEPNNMVAETCIWKILYPYENKQVSLKKYYELNEELERCSERGCIKWERGIKRKDEGEYPEGVMATVTIQRDEPVFLKCKEGIVRKRGIYYCKEDEGYFNES